MDFNAFADQISFSTGLKLPGKEAQDLMAARSRQSNPQYYYPSNKPKRSAVLILFYPVKELPHFVLIKRKEYPGVHSKQISFPGGKIEEADKDLKETALREAKEEIGIDVNKVRIIRELTDIYIPPSNYIVHPFLGISMKRQTFKRDEREVSQIIEVSLEYLLDEHNICETYFYNDFRKIRIKAPCFNFFENKVWGATAMILSELKEILCQSMH